MLKLRGLTIALLLTVASAAAFGSGANWSNVKVANIEAVTSSQFPPNGLAVITFSVNGTGTPGCVGANYKNLLVIDLSQPGGLAAYSAAQTAVTTQQNVDALGVGSCAVDAGVETLGSFTLLPPS